MQKTFRCTLAALGIAGFGAGMPTAHAGGAFTIKGGTMRLWNNDQDINGSPRTLDTSSDSAYGFSFETRKRNDIGLGIEYLNYRNHFTPPSSPEPGLARTQTLQFVARKYFDPSVLLHPFFGFGVGIGQTTVSYDTSTNSYKHNDANLALQAMAGLELRFDNNFGVSAELKGLYHDAGGTGNSYDASATGVFIGMTLLY
ncbi:MAG: hypothetical protein ACYDDO_06625 [Acidiferrobacterales bacterium]